MPDAAPATPATTAMATEIRRPATRRTYLLAGLGVAALTVAVIVVFALTRGDTISPSIDRPNYAHSPATADLVVDKASARAYRCTVEVQDDEHNPLGDVDVRVPAGASHVRLPVTIPFHGQAYVIEVTACVHLS